MSEKTKKDITVILRLANTVGPKNEPVEVLRIDADMKFYVNGKPEEDPVKIKQALTRFSKVMLENMRKAQNGKAES